MIDGPAHLDRALLVAGRRLPAYRCRVTGPRQAAYHAAADVDTGAFGRAADPSVLANDCIHWARPLKGRDDVNLHLWQRLLQHEPVHLDEELTLTGEIAAVTPARRGIRTTLACRFARADGSVPLEAEMGTLHVDPALAQAAPPAAAAAEACDTAGWRALSSRTLGADRVRAYSFEFPDYLFHFDAAVAASAGLPAPVAQGLMSLTAVTGAVWADGPPRRLDLEMRFLRPVFWGDRVTLWRLHQEYLCVKGAGEAVARAVVHGVVR